MKTLTLVAATISLCAISANAQTEDTTGDAFASTAVSTIPQSVSGDTAPLRISLPSKRNR